MQINTIKSIPTRNNLILQLSGTLSLQRSEVYSAASNKVLIIWSVLFSSVLLLT